MKKRYSLRTSGAVSGYRSEIIPGDVRLGLIAMGAIAVLLVLVRFIAPGALTTIATPFWNAGSSATAAVGSSLSFTSSQASQRALTERDAENAALSAQNAVLSARVADLERLLGGREEAPGILASVTSRPPVSPYDVLGIDRGVTSGVIEGAFVLGPGGTPIGTVSETAPTHARVVLYSAVGVATEGWAGVERVPVTLSGIGAGAVRAVVPREAGVAVGDGVYVAAAGAAPIGTIVAIDSDPSSPSVELHVRPYTNPFSLTWVSVLPQ